LKERERKKERNKCEIIEKNSDDEKNAELIFLIDPYSFNYIQSHSIILNNKLNLSHTIKRKRKINLPRISKTEKCNLKTIKEK
jgi:hypothetical protein